MAILLRGKHAGQHVTPHQWANDWMTIEEDPRVVSPASIQLEGDEIRAFVDSAAAELVLRYYDFDESTGRFKKRRRS